MVTAHNRSWQGRGARRATWPLAVAACLWAGVVQAEEGTSPGRFTRPTTRTATGHSGDAAASTAAAQATALESGSAASTPAPAAGSTGNSGRKPLAWRTPRRGKPGLPVKPASNSAAAEAPGGWAHRTTDRTDLAPEQMLDKQLPSVADAGSPVSLVALQPELPGLGGPVEELPSPNNNGPDSLDEAIAKNKEGELPDCPSPRSLKSIAEITNDVTPEAGVFPPACSLGDEVYQPRCWQWHTFTWKASALCHKPLYFEQVPLERYGHYWGPIIQPAMSAAHFFGSLPVLPYKMGVHPPGECLYDLGYYRPGNCAPQVWYRPPISMRGALLEGGAVTGLVFLVP